MRAFVIDDEFFNQSAIEATPRSSCRPALEKPLDTADIVRDGRKVAFLDRWFSRGYAECSFGQVMLHFRSFGHIMLQESSQRLHTQTESKAVTGAILCLIRPDLWVS